MKKYIALILALAALAMAGCSSSKEDETTETDAINETSAESETESETQNPILTPEEVDVIDFEMLELEKDPVYENGVMVVYFTDHDVWYDENTEANIGVVAADEAYTVKAEIDFDTYPDMKIDDKNHCGIALRPSFEIDPGEYRISITFDEYKVEFNMNIG